VNCGTCYQFPWPGRRSNRTIPYFLSGVQESGRAVGEMLKMSKQDHFGRITNQRPEESDPSPMLLAGWIIPVSGQSWIKEETAGSKPISNASDTWSWACQQCAELRVWEPLRTTIECFRAQRSRQPLSVCHTQTPKQTACTTVVYLAVYWVFNSLFDTWIKMI